jgi:hypothetical protein
LPPDAPVPPCTNNAPPESVPIPATTDMAPPSFDALLVSPANSTMAPPVCAAFFPLVIRSVPAAPVPAYPVAMEMLPVLPDAELPVASVNPPEAPETVESAVRIHREPLDVVSPSPAPDERMTWPPKREPDPALKAIVPPVEPTPVAAPPITETDPAVVDVVAVVPPNTINPAVTPVVAVPAARETEPPTPAEPEEMARKPPVNEAVVDPDAMYIPLLVPLLLEPTYMLTEPDRPNVASPVRISNRPEFPTATLPLLKTTAPVIPSTAAFAVWINTYPLVVVVVESPGALRMTTLPPALTPVPANTVTEPPVLMAVVPEPADNNTAPATDVLPL